MDWLWLVPVLPILGAFILAIFGGMMPKKLAGTIGCLSVGLSWIVSFFVAWNFITNTPSDHAFRQTLYDWMSIGQLHVSFGFYLDPLSLVMMCIVTFVGFLIHLYSTQYMYHEDGYSRFFCYMNLFVGSMLILLLGDNFISFYLGWEGVGLCSYLLIGFWYKDRSNGIAAQKAFIITRIGDTALAIALFLLFYRTGTFDIQQTLDYFQASGTALQSFAFVTALLIIGGAIGKSAQIPLHTWLPDAMAGPTPVSALIHAATMVTAGVYLIARTHTIFLLTPTAMLVVAIIGAATACYAGFCALAQRDIKRVLAYSTISQIGFMFLALGVGAWWAAIFHFVTHAFFKALLFLSAGIVTHALNEERDIFKMGGMFRQLPVAGWTFLIGAASLSALPLVTAGFYSKDIIVWESWSAELGSSILWTAAILASLLTSIYIFRVFFVAFAGDDQKPVEHRPGVLMNLVVTILAFFSITAGFIGMPKLLGGFEPLRHFLEETFHISGAPAVEGESLSLIISSFVSLFGISLSYIFFRRSEWFAALASSPIINALREFNRNGWGFDWLYDRLFVRPYIFLAQLDRNDVIDAFYIGLAYIAAAASKAVSATESGRVRNYATALLLGAVIITGLLLLK